MPPHDDPQAQPPVASDAQALKQARKKTLTERPALIDCHTHVGVFYESYLSSSFPYALSFEDLILRLDRLGIDMAIVFPGTSSYYSAPSRTGHDGSDARTESRFPFEKENICLLTEIYRVFPEYADRALPFFRFDPSRQPEKQVELFEQLREKYPVYGLKTVTSYTQSFLTDLEGSGRCILDFARRYDLPVLMHTAYLKSDRWGSVFDAIAIAERNPDIRFSLAHTVRFTRPVLEKAHALPNAFVDISAFDIHCRLARNHSQAIPPEGPERFDADYTHPASVLRKLADTYPGTILWGTDMPYNYSIPKSGGEGIPSHRLLKSSFEVEGQWLRALPAGQIEEIAYRNTLAFLFG